MARNNVYKDARNIRVPAPRDVASGDPVKVGAFCGVAQGSAASGEDVVIDRAGTWHIPVTGAAGYGDVVNINRSGTLSTGAGDRWGISRGIKGTGTAALEVTPSWESAPAAAGGNGGDD